MGGKQRTSALVVGWRNTGVRKMLCELLKLEDAELEKLRPAEVWAFVQMAGREILLESLLETGAMSGKLAVKVTDVPGLIEEHVKGGMVGKELGDVDEQMEQAVARVLAGLREK